MLDMPRAVATWTVETVEPSFRVTVSRAVLRFHRQPARGLHGFLHRAAEHLTHPARAPRGDDFFRQRQSTP